MIWVKLMLLLKNLLVILERMSQLNHRQVWKSMKSLVQDQPFSLGKVLDLKVSEAILKVILSYILNFILLTQFDVCFHLVLKQWRFGLPKMCKWYKIEHMNYLSDHQLSLHRQKMPINVFFIGSAGDKKPNSTKHQMSDEGYYCLGILKRK